MIHVASHFISAPLTFAFHSAIGVSRASLTDIIAMVLEFFSSVHLFIGCELMMNTTVCLLLAAYTGTVVPRWYHKHNNHHHRYHQSYRRRHRVSPLMVNDTTYSGKKQMALTKCGSRVFLFSFFYIHFKNIFYPNDFLLFLFLLVVVIRRIQMIRNAYCES